MQRTKGCPMPEMDICKEEECAWWCDGEKLCAMKLIAMQLIAIEEKI